MPTRWTSKDWPASEPPAHVMAVRDESNGHIMDRIIGASCVWCGQGTEWRWRHNGGTECWMDMDGIGPYTEVPPLSDHKKD